MIIAELHIVGVALRPAETEPPLFIYTNAVLSFSIAEQRLKPITRRDTQEVDACGAVDQIELSFRADRHVRRQRLYELPREQRSRTLVGERLDHT